MTCTSEQLTGPSSGSVTVTWNGIELPKAKVPPATGVVTTTIGAVFPAVITTLAAPVRPWLSVTVRTAV